MSGKDHATIFDVARLAGVARGTVDRVVYHRGGVSEKTAAKVKAAIRELGYKANPVAAQLASKRKFTIACLTPSYEKGDYWDTMQKGFNEGAAAVKSHSVSIRMYHFDSDIPESYLEACQQVLKDKPSGVLMNVVFEEALRSFVHSLEEARIPYAFVDRKIDDLDYTVYCGVDPWEAGYLGAYLLTHRMQVKEIGIIRLQRDPRGQSDPNKLRREGFMRYLRDYCPDCRVTATFIPPHDPEQILKNLEQFTKDHPDIKHFVMANSRVHLMRDFLLLHPDPQRSVVGYDDIERNLAVVKDSLVEYLVTRRTPLQAYYAVVNFASCLISGQPPKKRNYYMHVDILSRFNLKDYDTQSPETVNLL